MLDKLKQLVAAQIEEGGLEEEIQKHTFEIIDSTEFKDLSEGVQDAVYQLNMLDVNELGKEEYRELLRGLDKD